MRPRFLPARSPSWQREAKNSRGGDGQTKFVVETTTRLKVRYARGEDGGWAVVALWEGEAEADLAAGNPAAPAALTAFSALVDPASAQVQRFQTLD